MFKSRSDKITARKNAFGTTNFYDGIRLIGSSRESASGRTVYYDSHGKKVGSSSNKLDNKTYYDKKGKFVCESRKGNYGYIINSNPGPGQYSDNMKNKKHYPAWKIGTGSREDQLKRVIRDGYPGPGNYDFIGKNIKLGPKYGFGTEKRGGVRKSDTPGPGQYHIPCAIVDVNDYTREQGNFDPNYRYI